jgi:agmatine/peptidylarginine deiminase
MQSVLIRYPFGIPMSLIVEMSQDCKVKTIVENTFEQQYVLSQYIAEGVNTANCEWLIAPTDSYWTRDFGPWFVTDGNDEVGICDFPYNRPRPDDDEIPVLIAQQLGIPLYGMNLIHTGGNWMDDGMGIGASTQLVWEENLSLTHPEIDTLVKDYLGITKYHVLPDPLDEYIDHIDCWAKFLDVDKILIGQVSPSDYRYQDFEYVANYFALQTCSYGTPYQVYRVYTPGNYPYTPYTNSLILNKKVFVPITGSQWDDEALAVYEEAMPGYEIIGIPGNSWENTDALHCRAKGIADVGMLFIRHIPLSGLQDHKSAYDLLADIYPYSGMDLIDDSLLCYYNINGGEFLSSPLVLVDGITYKATLTDIPPGSEVTYYLHAADQSGRSKSHPYIGAPDPHVFNTEYISDLTIVPDSLIFLSVEDMLNGKSFDIINTTGSEQIIHDIEWMGENFVPWYIDPWSLNLPYTMVSNETLTLNVKINIPVANALGDLVVDTLDILAEIGHYKVVIKVDSDLLSFVADQDTRNSSVIESISPNPFSKTTRISFTVNEPLETEIGIYNLKGQRVCLLASAVFSAGRNEIQWNRKDISGNEVPAGIYVLRLITARGTDINKLIVSD